MPVRLIKVSKNLNVGINTLVEFLHKKGIEIEANPNAKIEDEQYDILIAEFGKDKNIRNEATITREKLHRRDDKRETIAIEGYELPEEQAPKKKVEKEAIETEIPNELKPHVNVVGTIDLDNLNKKKSESKSEETEKEEKEETIMQPPSPEEEKGQPEPEIEKSVPVKEPPVKEEVMQPQAEEIIVEEKTQEKTQEKAEEKEEVEEERAEERKSRKKRKRKKLNIPQRKRVNPQK